MRSTAIEREVSAFDVLDRVLTKGIVILYDIDISVAGLRLIEIDGDVTIMSLETYTKLVAPPADREMSEALVTAAQEYLKHLPGGDTLHLPVH